MRGFAGFSGDHLYISQHSPGSMSGRISLRLIQKEPLALNQPIDLGQSWFRLMVDVF